MKTKPYFLVLLMLSTAPALWGQATAPASAAAPDAAAGQLTGIMTWVIIAIASLLFFVAMIYMIKVNQFLYKRALQLEARLNNVNLPEDAPVVDVAGDDFWTKLRKKYWEDPVPVEREAEIILHHDFDGIRELDNRLPPWWVNMFILTIIYAFGYMFYYHWGGNGPSQKEEYENEMATAKKEMAAALAGKANSVDEASVVALTESSALGEGELIFKANCVACHGQKGEGGVGPNFTDEYWLHGGGIKNVFKTIKYGVPEKGMISWQSQLKPADMQKVASYILTLKGTNPPNPKAPQGTIWTEDAAAPQDSTKKADATTVSPTK
ncbi:MAG: cbb3-type cytochrome c oxidase N-terminal domain-containing protein [Bacteroidota bacterium]